jgi:tripartite-type tricarboxylate transporter receptor subunit TctC
LKHFWLKLRRNESCISFEFKQSDKQGSKVMKSLSQFNRRQMLCTLAAANFPLLAAAQTSPTIPSGQSAYKFLVGFGAGGVPDAAARVMANKLSERWKVPAIVENRLGAGGILAAQAVLSAPADGTHILSVSPAHATAPAIFKKVPYDTLNDFAPVTLIGEGPALIVIPNELKVRTLNDLIYLAKSSPGKLSYSSAGVGSSSHFASALLCQQANIDVLNIPYKSIGEALTEVMVSRVEFHIAPYISAIKLVKAGKLKVLAVTGRQRLADLPDVPTASESGVPNYEWSFWYGLLVSAKTPMSVVNQLHRDLTDVLKLPDVVQQINAMGVAISGSTPVEFKRLLESEVAKYSRIAKAANILPE